MKLVRILIVALGMMTIAAAAAFASVPFTTTSTLNQMAPNAQTGQAGTIQLTALTAGDVSLGEIILVTFNGGQISSLSDLSVTINANGLTGTAAPAAYNTAVNIGAALPGPPTVKVTNSTILITFPALTHFLAGDTIQIVGARLNVSASAVPGNQLTTTISSVLGSATVTNPTVPVAQFVEPIQILTGFGIPVVEQFTTAGTNPVTPAIVTVRELFTNAFETKGAGAETQLILRISNIPTGIVLSTVAIDAATSATVTATLPAVSVSQTGNQAFATVNIAAQDSTLIESIVLDLNFSVAIGATIPLPLGTATVAATLGPPATTTQLNNVTNNILPITVGGAGNPLRYAARFVPTPEVNILTVIQLTTQLLAVFNAWVPGSFDTGFAIANTTGFNVSLTQPLGNLAAQAGNVTAVLYPSDGSASKTVTTSSTVFGGTGGLNANGEIPPHGTWAILLSQLATQAGFTTGFTGQVYFVINSSNAHGINYIADSTFSSQAQGYAMLVVPTPRGLGFESLGQ